MEDYGLMGVIMNKYLKQNISIFLIIITIFTVGISFMFGTLRSYVHKKCEYNTYGTYYNPFYRSGCKLVIFLNTEVEKE